MPELLVTDRAGQQKRLTAETGYSVMEVIRDGGFDELLALCGGSCSCATCHVYVAADWIAAVGIPGADESDLLEGSSHRSEASRLSCQIEMNDALDGLSVTIAPED